MENSYSVILSPVVEQIVQYIHIDKNVLIMKGIRSFLTDKKRDILLERLNILLKYDVISKEELEHHIEQGNVNEHPAWEDLIAVENIDSELEKINGYLENL